MLFVKNIFFFLVIVSSFSYCSCTSYLAKRSHTSLTRDNFTQLEGLYEINTSSVRSEGTVFQHFSKDTLQRAGFRVKIICPDNHQIRLNYLSGDSVIKSVRFLGRYKNGYFVARRKLSCVFPPLFVIWGLRNEKKYFILSPEKNLTVVNSSGATAFALFIPVWNSGGDYEVVFTRQIK